MSDILPSSLRKFFGFLVVLFAAGLVLATFAFAFSYAVSAKKSVREPNFRQITINGEGKQTVQPDVAVFTASFVTQNAKLAAAKEENTDHSNAVLAYIKEKGVAEKDVKTILYSINPQYDVVPPCYTSPCPVSRPPKISGYEVRHTLEVKVRDLGKVDELLDGVVKKGANEVGEIRFTLDDEDAAKGEARKKAVEDARQKAEMMAAALGVRLGKVISFYDNSGSPIPYGADYGKGGAEVRTAAPAPTHLAPGEQEIQASVAVTYEIR